MLLWGALGLIYIYIYKSRVACICPYGSCIGMVWAHMDYISLFDRWDSPINIRGRGTPKQRIHTVGRGGARVIKLVDVL